MRPGRLRGLTEYQLQKQEQTYGIRRRGTIVTLAHILDPRNEGIEEGAVFGRSSAVPLRIMQGNSD